jgi:hypothetical protein
VQEGSDDLKDHHVAEFESHLSDDDISDLTYAFQACDLDRGGTIEVVSAAPCCVRAVRVCAQQAVLCACRTNWPRCWTCLVQR